MTQSKRLLKTAFFYAIFAMVGGVFYREFTKFNSFDYASKNTSLGFVHTHLFLLGMVFFLLLFLLDRQFAVTERRGFRSFYIIYNLGLLILVAGLVWRGIPQTLGMSLSSGLDGAISGISGLGHILVGIGIIQYFVLLFRQLKAKAK